MQSPITRAPWTLVALAAVVAFSTLTCGGPPDDIGHAQLVDAKQHAARDAEERRVAAALREGRKQ
jgi:hypothetical protein